MRNNRFWNRVKQKGLVGLLGTGLALGSVPNLTGCGLEIPGQVYDDIDTLRNLPEDPDVNTLNNIAWHYGIPTMYFFRLNQAPKITGTYALAGTEYCRYDSGNIGGPYFFRNGTLTISGQDDSGNLNLSYETPARSGAGSGKVIIRGEANEFTIYSYLEVYGQNFESGCHVVFEGTVYDDGEILGNFISVERDVLEGAGTNDSFGTFCWTKK